MLMQHHMRVLQNPHSKKSNILFKKSTESTVYILYFQSAHWPIPQGGETSGLLSSSFVAHHGMVHGGCSCVGVSPQISRDPPGFEASEPSPHQDLGGRVCSKKIGVLLLKKIKTIQVFFLCSYFHLIASACGFSSFFWNGGAYAPEGEAHGLWHFETHGIALALWGYFVHRGCAFVLKGVQRKGNCQTLQRTLHLPFGMGEFPHKIWDKAGGPRVKLTL